MAGGSVGFVGGNEKPRAGVAGAGLILERVESLRGWLLGFFGGEGGLDGFGEAGGAVFGVFFDGEVASAGELFTGGIDEVDGGVAFDFELFVEGFVLGFEFGGLFGFSFV